MGVCLYVGTYVRMVGCVMVWYAMLGRVSEWHAMRGYMLVSYNMP